MRISNPALNPVPVRSLLVGAAIGLVAFAANAANMAPDKDNYDWSATLVSFDRARSTAVFQARIEEYPGIDNLDQFRDGDRLMLVWTGRSWAAGIRALAEHPEMTPGALVLPVEFVAAVQDNRYLNFRVHVPESAFETLAAMSEGDRVTGMSPREAGRFESSVVSLRPYNEIE